MKKSCEKLLLLSYLIKAMVPFLPYADQYGMVEVKLYPIQGSINMIIEVEFHFDN
ncbi:hypothetical protein MUO65_06650 [bacterium]|nr:hypothetical protein [bacterium]